ncbi:uncharacterized protein LOC121735883 [Aricia agestis]|uniref:uncharacterized protein LOC121735883 n=1 Tax=Aricia agestis TaxID=91739 RepID=UPI001C20B175|nr:uncharacterized protein LOC121735883 [Aricia agestis]
MAATKFSTEPGLLILSVAALIMFSGAVVTQGRQCYWCGPLAEQVHRSARAPACDSPAQLTTCDPGLDFCAVVATAPPYIESRYCVKNYRDECYPLYCNTTRAWKMICPCKENLCNGPNTEREKTAFDTLLKLVESNRTKRIAKRTGSTGQFIKSNTEKTKIITNITGIQENMLNGTFEERNDLTEIIFSSESAMDAVGSLDDNLESTTVNDLEAITDEPDTTVDDIKLTEVESVQDEILPVVTTSAPVVTDVPQMSTSIQKPMVDKMDDAPNSMDDASNKIDDTLNKIEDTLNKMDDTSNKMDDTGNKIDDYSNKIDDSQNKMDDLSSKIHNTPKPSEVLPTAEALQQNASPSPVVSEKATEPTTTVETTTLLTTPKIEKPINQTKKNGDIKINSSIFLVVVTFFVQLTAL